MLCTASSRPRRAAAFFSSAPSSPCAFSTNLTSSSFSSKPAAFPSAGGRCPNHPTAPCSFCSRGVSSSFFSSSSSSASSPSGVGAGGTRASESGIPSKRSPSSTTCRILAKSSSSNAATLFAASAILSPALSNPCSPSSRRSRCKRPRRGTGGSVSRPLILTRREGCRLEARCEPRAEKQDERREKHKGRRLSKTTTLIAVSQPLKNF